MIWKPTEHGFDARPPPKAATVPVVRVEGIFQDPLIMPYIDDFSNGLKKASPTGLPFPYSPVVRSPPSVASLSPVPSKHCMLHVAPSHAH